MLFRAIGDVGRKLFDSSAIYGATAGLERTARRFGVAD